jgi:hypothetical protein
MKRRTTLLALFFGFVAGTLVGYLLCRRPAADPRTPRDLAAALEARGLRLRCVPDGTFGAAFLTETDASPHSLALLHLRPPESWKGTVHAAPLRPGLEPLGKGVRAGGFFLTGDPGLLKQIADALR